MKQEWKKQEQKRKITNAKTKTYKEKIIKGDKDNEEKIMKHIIHEMGMNKKNKEKGEDNERRITRKKRINGDKE